MVWKFRNLLVLPCSKEETGFIGFFDYMFRYDNYGDDGMFIDGIQINGIFENGMWKIYRENLSKPLIVIPIEKNESNYVSILHELLRLQPKMLYGVKFILKEWDKYIFYEAFEYQVKRHKGKKYLSSSFAIDLTTKNIK